MKHLHSYLSQLKCSRTEPCGNCFKATITCEYREVDHKRRPASYDHVVLLQSRIAWLEDFVTKLQHLGHMERDALLRSFVPLSPASPRESKQDIFNLSDIGSFNILTLQPGAEGSLSYYGPTSIYRLQSGAEANFHDSGQSASQVESLSNVDHVLDHFGIDIDANVVSDSLMLFFKWQYPHLMFVYRDAFLRDHFNHRTSSKYWSPALLLSICALGSLLLDDCAARSTSDQFYGAAESIALVTGLTRPSIITVQTFLCLAFYEIGRGNPSKGWAYSGASPKKRFFFTLLNTNEIIQESGFAWPKSLAFKKILNYGSHMIFLLRHLKIWRFAGVFIGVVTFQISS